MLGNQLYGVQAAAKMLGVNARTVQYALKRFKRGRRLPVGTTGRFVLMLTKQDVVFLDKNLRRKVGRPCKSKEKQPEKKEA
jgi:DNA-binding transcriptional regulator YhcF (GntR family)